MIRLLERRPLVLMGLISYSLFLWHEPLVRWLQTHGLTMGGRAGFGVNLLLIGTISGVLAALTYRFVERPALSRKSGRTVQRAGGPIHGEHSEGAISPESQASAQVLRVSRAQGSDSSQPV